MNTAIVARSALSTSLARYWRSWSLWLLLLVAPLGARYMIGSEDGGGVIIAVDGHLPELTSAFLGVSLGIVVSTLLLPVGWIYLRSNTTRRQPWQIEETTAASRVAIALGRFTADATVLYATLAALSCAGLFLGVLLLPIEAWRPDQILFGLWLVAAPAVTGLAALRILFDARPLLRGGFGDFAFFILWVFMLAAPAIAENMPRGFAANMLDFAGFVTPLRYGATSGGESFVISLGGGYPIEPGRAPLDVMAGLLSPGYAASRATWFVLAIAIAATAGLVYQPHRPRRRQALGGRMGALLNAGPPSRAMPDARAATPSMLSVLDAIVAEFRLIGAGRVFLVLAFVVAVIAAFADFRHVASPAALLLLAFAASAHAGRTEARGLIALTRTTATSPWMRRAAFIVAAAAWALALAAPAMLRAPALDITATAATTGAALGFVAITVSSMTGSAFAARLILLVLWYGYVSV
jgi:hypothetical protein